VEIAVVVGVGTGVGDGLIKMSVGPGGIQRPTVLVGGASSEGHRRFATGKAGSGLAQVHVIHSRNNEWCDVAVTPTLAGAVDFVVIAGVNLLARRIEE
jgi:hypothetical protein